jgi:ribosomal protein S18 acetylase RimI-like enzyme
MSVITGIQYQVAYSTAEDLPMIYSFFEEAIAYIKQHNYVGWETYDKKFIEQDINNKLQFKIVSNDTILCVFSICMADELIWRERENHDAVYLHRIVVNPACKGQKQFQKILHWIIYQAGRKGLKYIRMDTWAKNPGIIQYYESFGFRFIEHYTTPDTTDLPGQHRNLMVALLQLELNNSTSSI